jgi:glycosyltransferase involved in cell wall biosynthesis
VADPEDTRAGAVAVAYIYRGHNVTYSWHHSMIELIGYDLCHEGRIIRGGYVAMKCGADGHADARNKAVKLFLQEDRAEWLFWIDTDMGFAPDTVERLLEAADPLERPMVGGLAFTQREEESDGLGGWRCRAAPTVFDWTVLDDGQMGFTVRWKYPPDQLTRVGGTGAACALVHRSVFERLEAARAANPKLGFWYDRVPNTTTSQLVSEDLSMCLRAGALDIPIWVHTGVKTTHQKILWLAEDDYFGQVALSQMVPQVPAATEATAVIVPVLHRPGNAAPFMESLAASGAPLAKVYAVADYSDLKTILAWEDAGATVLIWKGPAPGTFAQKVNRGYSATAEPWLLLAGDDVRFHPGWLDQAQHAARDGADVIGTNDLHNPRVTSGEHSPHPLVRRAYIDEQGASWDGPKVVAHEGYRHWFVDQEIVDVAKQRGAWAMAVHSKVEHLHPLWGLAEDDSTYRLGQEHVEQDKALFAARLAEHGA